jgi:hypothetical protein
MMNYWRNNAGIEAVNQYLFYGLNEIGYKRLTVIDVFPLILSRVSRWPREIVAVNHFLAVEYNKTFTTPSGLALVNELINDLCRGSTTSGKLDHIEEADGLFDLYVSLIEYYFCNN